MVDGEKVVDYITGHCEREFGRLIAVADETTENRTFFSRSTGEGPVARV